MTERYANNAISTLSAACAAGDTTITLTNAAGFSTQGNFRVVCDSEIMLVTSVAGNVFTVTRGVEGTIAAAHAAGVSIIQALTAASHQIISSLPCEGRLTLTSGVPVTTADVTNVATFYFTPYNGNRIALLDANNEWGIYTFSEVSLPVPNLSANMPCDVFAYLSGGNVAFNYTNWVGPNTRTNAIGYRDGVPVDSTNNTRRYLGTISEGATAGQISDSATSRLVWNYYNRRVRPLRWSDPAGSWTYGTATWRQANANANARVWAVLGMVEDAVLVFYLTTNDPSGGGTTAYGGIGRNSTTTPLASPIASGAFCGVANPSYGLIFASVSDISYPVGLNYWSAMEACQGNVSMTFFNIGGPVPSPNLGLNGQMLG